MAFTFTQDQINEMLGKIATGLKRQRTSDGRELEYDLSSMVKALTDPVVVDPGDPGGGGGFTPGANRSTFAKFSRD